MGAIKLTTERNNEEVEGIIVSMEKLIDCFL